jgi:hypothetical protein
MILNFNSDVMIFFPYSYRRRGATRMRMNVC